MSRVAHLKRLTLVDLAARLRDDDALKEKIVEAVLPLSGKARTKKGLLKAIDSALAEVVETCRARYHVTCGHCDLSHVLEAKDQRTAGLRLECCVCGTVMQVALPERRIVVRCVCCGTPTSIKRIEEQV